jgi:hypothetical protein
MRIALWILYLVGMGAAGYALGNWRARRRWLKNEREGVYSEPEGVEPCVGKLFRIDMYTKEEVDAMKQAMQANHECDVKKWADSLVDRGKLAYLSDGRYMDKTGFTFRVEEK